MIQLPPNLKKGDSIGMLCPAGFMSLKNANTCIQTLTKWGFKVFVGKTLGGKQKNYFAGTDDERLADFQQMLDDENIKAIFCARGGYGVSRIIDTLNFSKFKKNPKWIIGYSDITVLHAHINSQLKIASLHAPMAAAFNNNGFKNNYTLSIKKAITGYLGKYTCATHAFNKQGEATAELIGGNLVLIAHLIGSKSAYKTTNKILFIEDVGEYLYNIDRMFVQLKRAGVLDKLKGLIIGKFSDLKDTTAPFGLDVYTIIQHHVKEYHYPICFDFPVGHVTENVALKVGGIYTLKIDKKKTMLMEIKK